MARFFTRFAVLAVAALALASRLAAAQCDLTQWPTYQQVDLSTDTRATELATEALKEYTQGLEQASPDLVCQWEERVTTMESACADTTQSGADPATQRYALRFAYSVPCKAAGEEGQEPEELVLSGVIEGELPAPTAVEAEQKAASTRNLLMDAA